MKLQNNARQAMIESASRAVCKTKLQNNAGQAMIESAFVVLFISVIMLCFIQILVSVTNDLIANEAAFVSMRSAAVTKSSDRIDEAKKRSAAYFLWYGILPIPLIPIGDSFTYGMSTRDAVSPYYKRDGANASQSGGDNSYISMVAIDKNKSFTDYSNKTINAQILQIYYATKVFMGSLTASGISAINFWGSGSIRYEASRSALVPSPDEDYYYKAFPGAKNFD
ncbi:MAG: hypothetical protein LBT79_05450 [Elusimicrobiota bacterium]|jgi:hypothetical protein|nr:hypothetical protein [Elusimicrobiota bacterium]